MLRVTPSMKDKRINLGRRKSLVRKLKRKSRRTLRPKWVKWVNQSREV